MKKGNLQPSLQTPQQTDKLAKSLKQKEGNQLEQSYSAFLKFNSSKLSDAVSFLGLVMSDGTVATSTGSKVANPKYNFKKIILYLIYDQ